MASNGAVNGGALLFGGYIIRSSGKASVFGDTWLWNGDNQTWTQQKPATRPPSRWDASMAYDLLSGHVILFGGLNTNQARTAYGDTWVWGQLGP